MDNLKRRFIALRRQLERKYDNFNRFIVYENVLYGALLEKS